MAFLALRNGRFRVRNGLFGVAKRPVLEREMACMGMV